jgi:glucose/arabinose dehydrogenase
LRLIIAEENRLRKLFIGVGLVLALLVCVSLALLASGTINLNSPRMVLNLITGLDGPPANAKKVEQRFSVPEGFSLELYAKDLPKARFMRFTPDGDLLLSRPHRGDVLLLRRDQNGDGHPDAVETLLKDLKRPLGLDIAGEYLYVAESNRIGRVAFDSASGTLAGPYEPLVEGFTDNGNHWSKTLRVGPDGLLYLAQGSTCNACVEEDERRNTIMRFERDGSGGEILATGLRNSVGFDWAPWSGELYATDNGRDLLGDNFPHCELNLIEEGRFYGWPYFNDNNVPDPDMWVDPSADAREPTPPVHGFRPHNAPLGITFVDSSGWPAGYERVALAALHGSWNRSTPDGYEVVSLHWTEEGIEERDFLTGFNKNGNIAGRPVDVAQGPDGAIYISDDYAGAIYRVTHNAGGAAPSPPMEAAGISLLDSVAPEWLADADLSAMAQSGAALYSKYGCRSCHEEGENPKLLNGLSDRLGYTAVIDVLQAPQSPMPVFPLTEVEQRELAVFLLNPDVSFSPAIAEP